MYIALAHNSLHSAVVLHWNRDICVHVIRRLFETHDVATKNAKILKIQISKLKNHDFFDFKFRQQNSKLNKTTFKVKNEGQMPPKSNHF